MRLPSRNLQGSRVGTSILCPEGILQLRAGPVQEWCVQVFLFLSLLSQTGFVASCAEEAKTDTLCFSVAPQLDSRLEPSRDLERSQLHIPPAS